MSVADVAQQLGCAPSTLARPRPAAGTGTYKDLISSHVSDSFRDRSRCNRGCARSDGELRSGGSISFILVLFATASTATSNTASAVWTYLDVVVRPFCPIKVAMAASLESRSPASDANE